MADWLRRLLFFILIYIDRSGESCYDEPVIIKLKEALHADENRKTPSVPRSFNRYGS